MDKPFIEVMNFPYLVNNQYLSIFYRLIALLGIIQDQKSVQSLITCHIFLSFIEGNLLKDHEKNWHLFCIHSFEL